MERGSLFARSVSESASFGGSADGTRGTSEKLGQNLNVGFFWRGQAEQGDHWSLCPCTEKN